MARSEEPDGFSNRILGSVSSSAGKAVSAKWHASVQGLGASNGCDSSNRYKIAVLGDRF